MRILAKPANHAFCIFWPYQFDSELTGWWWWRWWQQPRPRLNMHIMFQLKPNKVGAKGHEHLLLWLVETLRLKESNLTCWALPLSSSSSSHATAWLPDCLPAWHTAWHTAWLPDCPPVCLPDCLLPVTSSYLMEGLIAMFSTNSLMRRRTRGTLIELACSAGSDASLSCLYTHLLLPALPPSSSLALIVINLHQLKLVAPCHSPPPSPPPLDKHVHCWHARRTVEEHFPLQCSPLCCFASPGLSAFFLPSTIWY